MSLLLNFRCFVICRSWTETCTYSIFTTRSGKIFWIPRQQHQIPRNPSSLAVLLTFHLCGARHNCGRKDTHISKYWTRFFYKIQKNVACCIFLFFPLRHLKLCTWEHTSQSYTPKSEFNGVCSHARGYRTAASKIQSETAPASLEGLNLKVKNNRFSF